MSKVKFDDSGKGRWTLSDSLLTPLSKHEQAIANILYSHAATQPFPPSPWWERMVCGAASQIFCDVCHKKTVDVEQGAITSVLEGMSLKSKLCNYVKENMPNGEEIVGFDFLKDSDEVYKIYSLLDQKVWNSIDTSSMYLEELAKTLADYMDRYTSSMLKWDEMTASELYSYLSNIKPEWVTFGWDEVIADLYEWFCIKNKIQFFFVSEMHLESIRFLVWQLRYATVPATASKTLEFFSSTMNPPILLGQRLRDGIFDSFDMRLVGDIVQAILREKSDVWSEDTHTIVWNNMRFLEVEHKRGESYYIGPDDAKELYRSFCQFFGQEPLTTADSLVDTSAEAINAEFLAMLKTNVDAIVGHNSLSKCSNTPDNNVIKEILAYLKTWAEKDMHWVDDYAQRSECSQGLSEVIKQYYSNETQVTDQIFTRFIYTHSGEDCLNADEFPFKLKLSRKLVDKQEKYGAGSLIEPEQPIADLLQEFLQDKSRLEINQMAAYLFRVAQFIQITSKGWTLADHYSLAKIIAEVLNRSDKFRILDAIYRNLCEHFFEVPCVLMDAICERY